MVWPIASICPLRSPALRVAVATRVVAAEKRVGMLDCSREDRSETITIFGLAAEGSTSPAPGAARLVWNRRRAGLDCGFNAAAPS
jgi:hypothetical protein